MEPQNYDAVVVGAGFGGINALYSLLDLGLSVKIIEKGDGPGGTWFWNRYPGAMSDTPSFLYRYSWDKEDLRQYPWVDNYLDSQDVRAYLEHVIDRHNLQEHIQYSTELTSAKYEENQNVWMVETSSGKYTARYLITALGLLSSPNLPYIPGRENFGGEVLHTARWPQDCNLKNKRVGVIGNGSSGVQLISAIAKDVKALLCFQRHAQYTIPAARRPVSKAERDAVNTDYDNIWDLVGKSQGGLNSNDSKTRAMDVSAEEREQIYQNAWDKGCGMLFFSETFCDLAYDEAANQTVCEFIKKKIRDTVKDPEKRRKLIPDELYIRRPLCDSGYYEQFNRDNVDIVDIKANPIAKFTRSGLELRDGTTHELDVVVFATGFDAFDGAYRKVHIEGRDGIKLSEYWKDGATSNMGVAVPNFPNLFMIVGPKSALANVPPMIEAHVEFIKGIIDQAEQHRKKTAGSPTRNAVVESTKEGEQSWTELCDMISEKLLFQRSETSYFYGSNVQGKPRTAMVFFGGFAMFRQKLQECAASGYKSFYPF